VHGKEAMHTQSTTQSNPWLASISSENRLWIHADRAARQGIENGDWVTVTSPVGEVRVRARVTEGIHPEVVYLAHGYGHGVQSQRLSYGKGANDNVLIADRVEPVGGGAALGETIVTVRKG